MTNEQAAQLIESLETAHTIIAATVPLLEKAKALVEMIADAEANHGALIGTNTLRAANELRLELSRWK